MKQPLGDNRSCASSLTSLIGRCERRAGTGLILIVGLCLLMGVVGSSLAERQWEEGPGYRRMTLKVADTESVGFSRLDPASTGIAFTNHLAQERYTTNQIFLNGSGVAAGDIDRDGNCDLYFARLDGPNRLYRNLGDWQFEEMAERAGVACPDVASTGVALADLNGNGHLDLVVNTIADGTRIFRNDGSGRFRRFGESPLNPNKGAMSLALADIDGSGFLDLYVANYRAETIRDRLTARFEAKMVDGEPQVVAVDGVPVTDERYEGRFSMTKTGRVLEHGEVDAVYLNAEGQGFERLPFTEGAFEDPQGEGLTEKPYDWGLSVMFRDLTGDLRPDIYVCNDFHSEDRVWINQGGGRFRAIPREAFRSTSMFAMGVDFADLNQDGWEELFVADMRMRDHVLRNIHLDEAVSSGDWHQYSRNTLFLNRGDLTFAEIGRYSGVQASDWSWSPIFLDVDLDGHEDLLITTGHELYGLHGDVSRRIEAIRAKKEMSHLEQLRLGHLYPRLDQTNVLFRNRGDLTFEPANGHWGMERRTVSHGMALADLDNDGDLDVGINNMNEVAGIYRNEADAPRVAVRLHGEPPNTRGIGARIEVSGGPVPQQQQMIAGGRYLSDDQDLRVFAAGDPQNRLTLRVFWPSGRVSVLEDVASNHLYEVMESQAAHGADVESGASAQREDPSGPDVPLFEEVSDWIEHEHADEPFDDFSRQPLMPKRLSELGPGVAWFDVDDDGWEDLIIGSGRGGRLAAYRNQRGRGFERMEHPPFSAAVTRDQTGILGHAPEGYPTVLMTGSSNYEDGLAVGSLIRTYNVSEEQVAENFPAREAATGPLAMTDMDGDGRLELFVGGRARSGRFPEPVASLVFQWEDGKWEIDPVNSEPLEEVGLVSGAVWADLTRDGFPELVLACEWGPIRVFENEGGRLREATANWGLEETVGWWQGVTAGDFNGDGQMAVVAANWGRNNLYHARGIADYRAVYSDLTGDETLEVIESYWDPRQQQQVPYWGLKAMGEALPFVRKQYRSLESYGKASLSDLLGDRLESATDVEIDTWASTLFRHVDGRLVAEPLPREAQLAPALAVNAADMDGDGHQDLFLGQNFFGTHPERARLDAGRGLWLRGDGHGGLETVSGEESGIKLYGEQRAAASADFNQDGRVDLVITQNQGPTRLYRNARAQPGVRVTLKGPAGNPNGIGATVRLRTDSGWGAAQEVRAGSGYWSQNSASLVLTEPGAPTKARVRWPGGKVTETDLGPGAGALRIEQDGTADRLEGP